MLLGMMLQHHIAIYIYIYIQFKLYSSLFHHLHSPTSTLIHLYGWPSLTYRIILAISFIYLYLNWLLLKWNLFEKATQNNQFSITFLSCSSAKYSRLTSLFGMTSFVLIPRAESRTWTGRPYSKSSKHTWQTFFNLLHVWQTSVFLYLASLPGLHLNTVNGRVHILHSLSKLALVCDPDHFYQENKKVSTNK